MIYVIPFCLQYIFSGWPNLSFDPRSAPHATQASVFDSDNKVEPNKPAYDVDVSANKIEGSFEMIDVNKLD